MEVKKLKNIVSNSLLGKGFENKRNFFYKRDKELIYVIGMQKSKYSDGIYVNVGYVIRELHPDDEFPKDVDGDIRTRFSLSSSDGKETDIFDTDNKLKDIEDFISNNVEELIESVQCKGLNWLLEKDPTLLYQTTLKAKEYLQLD